MKSLNKKDELWASRGIIEKPKVEPLCCWVFCWFW